MASLERWMKSSDLPDVWHMQTTKSNPPQHAASISQNGPVVIALHGEDTRQQINPNPPQQAASTPQDEPAGLALHGTELKDFLKPVPQQLRERFFDIKVLYAQSLYDSISRRKKDPGNVSMKLRYLGLDSQNTELHIVIQCEKRVVKKVKKFFSQKHVEEELLPDFRVLVLGNPPMEVANDNTIDVLSDSPLNRTMCGMPITLSVDGKSVSCALGGVIVVETDQKRLYGLIAGHPLKRLRAGCSGKQPMYEVDESSSSSEEEEDSESDDISAEILLSPSQSVHSENERTVDGNTMRTKLQIGTVVHDSFSISPEENYDWALVDLNLEYALPNLVNWNKKPEDSDLKDDVSEIHRYYANSLNTAITKKVLVLKQDGPRMANLSFNTSSLMMSPGMGFVNAHDVVFEDGSSLRRGDSGIWVVDARTLGLYGHVVSMDAFGEAQVIPIQSTLQSIRRQLKATRVYLATRIDLLDLKLLDLELSKSRLSDASEPTGQLRGVFSDTTKSAESSKDMVLNPTMVVYQGSSGESSKARPRQSIWLQ